MKAFEIEGKVVFINLEGGFWGIQGTDGTQWLPVPMPAGLQTNGLNVRVRAAESEAISLYMWGAPIRILSYMLM